MANVKVLNKNIRVGQYDIIKVQISMYCFSKHIQLSENEIDCLILLCAYHEYGLAEFCKLCSEKKIFKTPQTVRNFINKACSLEIINKNGNSRKTIVINDDLEILTTGNILLKYNIAYVAEKK